MQMLITTTVFYALGLVAYWLLLRPLAAHHFNRGYLLAVLLGGILLPFVPSWDGYAWLGVSMDTVAQAWLPQVSIGPTATEMPAFEREAPTSITTWLTWAYVLGLAIGIGLVWRSAVRLRRVFSESEAVVLEGHWGIKLYTSSHAGAPFSFGRRVWVSDWTRVPEEEQAVMLRHEAAHARLGHLLDNVLSTAVLFVLWFHPLVYALRRELRRVHELQADAAVLSVTSPAAYQSILLRHQFYDYPALAYGFAGSPLQSRFMMMNVAFRQNQRWRLVVAVFGLLGLAAACTAEDALDPKKIENLVPAPPPPPPPPPLPPPPPPVPPAPDSTSVFRVVDQMPRFSACEEVANQGDQAQKVCSEKKMIEHIYSNLRYPQSSRDSGIEGKVICHFIVNLDGSLSDIKILKSPDTALSEEVVRVLTAMPRWQPGQQDGKDVRVQFTLPVQFKLG